MMTYIKQLSLLAVSVTLITLGSVAQAATFTVDKKSDLDVVKAKVQAAQFLSRATFGPTKADLVVDDTDGETSLAERILDIGARNAFEEWIDTQLDETATPPTFHHSLAKEMIIADGWPDFLNNRMSTTVYRHYSWWDSAITADDQLRQRMAWALSQIFVINDFNSLFNGRALDDSGEPRYLGPSDYYDIMVADAFGNYRDVLGQVTRHPIMGNFLSHRGNWKADEEAGTYPDENFGREVEQLFSIGLYLIKRNGDYVLDKNKDPIASYDNDDILSFSRAFTGLDYADKKLNLHDPMEMFPERHDTEEKVLHNGTVLPALAEPATVEASNNDVEAALDNLFEHQNTGPFIARLLIQRLVKSNPTSRYIDAVAAAFNDNGAGVRGDLGAMVKEILLNKEALESYSYTTKRRPWRLKVEGGGTEDSRLQEPVIRYAAMVRAFVQDADGGTDPANQYYSIPDRSYWLNQEAYRAPHVFNYYLPNHVPGGDLQDYRPKGRIPNRTVYAPEFEILTAVAANRIANYYRFDVHDEDVDITVRRCLNCTPTTESIPFCGSTEPPLTEQCYYNASIDIVLDFSQEKAILDAGDPDPDIEGLLDHLDILLCHGSLSDTAKDSLSEIISTKTDNTTYRVRGAIMSLLTAPDCAIHE
jgi:uncharacterized protein (DUF1800 family)